ncbi:MAG: cadherin-like domain-containing protein, partial [bacterium]
MASGDKPGGASGLTVYERYPGCFYPDKALEHDLTLLRSGNQMKQLATEKINPARAHLNLAFILLLSVFLGACGGGGGGGSSAPASPTTVSVTGTASKGALFNATITAFPLNSDGSRGATPIATTTTDATGNYQLTLNPSQFVVLVVTGGSYVDEATMTTLSLAPGEEFEAYAQVPANGQIRVNITPLTSMAAAQARSHIANDGQTLAAAVANANAEISATFDVGDVLTTNLPSLVSLGSASVQEINYVLLLAGFSQMDSNDGGQSAVDIVDAVAADVNTDGLWGNAGTETPQTLLAATNQFLAVNAGTISQSLSSTATNSLSQPILDVEAGGDNTNDTPVASDDAVTLNEGATANIDLAANDFDPENALDLASIVITTAPANGSITVNANGTVDYTHDGSETTNDTFSYTIADLGGLVTAAANVSVTVTPVNDIPVAADDAATLNEGAGTTIDLGANDSDGDDGLDLTSITIIAAPANGTIDAINNDGTVDYTHNGGETVSDSFTYTIDDLAGASSNVATVAITVNPVNDTPVATDDAATLNEARTLTIDLGANDTDADDGLDLTSIAIVSAPVNGTIDAINADGTVDYTHDGSSTTSDSFTYTIDDNSGAGSNTATVNLTVLQDFNEALYATPVVSSASDSGGANVRQFQANDGLTLDSANGWVVNNAAPGPHTLTLNFTSAKLIHSVALSDLVDLVNNVTSATLTFSNGDTPIAVGALPTDGTEQKIIFPAPKLLSSITVTLDTADTTAFGLSEFKAFSSLEAGQKAEEVELFNDGDAAVDTRWTVVDDCDKGTSSWSAATNNEYRQTGDCRGFTATEGVEIGTYQVLTDGFLVKDMDLRLRLKSSDNAG